MEMLKGDNRAAKSVADTICDEDAVSLSIMKATPLMDCWTAVQLKQTYCWPNDKTV